MVKIVVNALFQIMFKDSLSVAVPASVSLRGREGTATRRLVQREIMSKR